MARRGSWAWFIVGLVLAAAGTSSWLGRMLSGVRYGVTVCGVTVGGLLAPEVCELLVTIAGEYYVPPQDATIDRLTGRIIPERHGSELDVHGTVSRVMAAPRYTAVEPVLAPIDPLVYASDLAAATAVLGQYVTSVGGSEHRAFNVKLATSLLNYTVVPPGGLFSFNEVVGPRTSERGFRPAPVFIGNGTVLDAGGGVCQVASTLYNAVLAAGLEVVERTSHSQPVSYVPPGRDATVAYPYLDLKFVNTRRTPVVVRGQLTGRSLHIWIAGQATD